MRKLAREIQTIVLDYNVLMIEEDTRIQNVNILRASDEWNKVKEDAQRELPESHA